MSEMYELPDGLLTKDAAYCAEAWAAFSAEQQQQSQALRALICRLKDAANNEGLTPYQRFLVMSAILREQPRQSLAHIKAEAVREAARTLPKNYARKHKKHWTIDYDVLMEHADQMEKDNDK